VSGYHVNTDYLHGYANQLEMNQLGGITTLTSYAGTHLTNFDRFSGLFEPAQWLPELFAKMTNDLLLPQLSGSFTYISEQLGQTAIAYDAADRSAKSRVVAAGMGQGGGAGVDQPPAEDPPRQVPVALGFTNGAEVDPKPPADTKMTGWVEDKINGMLGEPAEIVKELTGFDIVAEWTPVILGDWGAAYRIADAWNEVGHTLRAIGADVEGGLTLLSAHWTAADEGGAAAAFARFTNDRLGGLAFFGEWTDAVSELIRVPAIYCEGVLTNAIWVIEYYGVRFKGVAKKISKALREVTPNPLTWVGLLEELWGVVEDYIEFIKTTWTALEKCVQLIIDVGQACIETIDAIAAYFEWRG